jgi:glutathione peroxidase
LHRELGGQGLAVVGFPCNQFGAQEPGDDAEIQEFCSTNYSVTFPVFAKIDVNGPTAHPLYQYLRHQQPGDFGPDTKGAEQLYAYVSKAYPELMGTDAVKWNFTKFLVGCDGEVLRRFEPTITPEEIHDELAALLA